MVASSMVMASFGFMMYSLNVAIAGQALDSRNTTVPHIPINADGSITVKLTTEQLTKIAAPAIQNINLELINGRPVSSTDEYNRLQAGEVLNVNAHIVK